MAVRLGGYARISLDKDGREMGVDRQRQDYSMHAATRPGWTIADHYIDNDVSAYKKTVRRPQFERLLADLTNGVIDGFITYDLDRVARQPRDLERLIDIYEANPKLVFCTIKQDYDLSDSDGRFMARLLVNVANKASADTSRRIARKHKELAENGKNGGGHRAFGWNEDRLTVNEAEAALIRKAHEDLLAGTRISTVTREWQAQGVQTARKTAAPISRTAVKAILSNWRLCGYRAVKGDVFTGADGKPVIGESDAITTPERLEAVRAVLEGTKQRYAAKNPNDTNAYRYLLSGILRCANCGARMTPNLRSSWTPGGKGSRFSYRCPTQGDGGCGKVSRAGEPLDEWITALVHDAEAALSSAIEMEGPEDWSGESRLAEVEAEITVLMDALNLALNPTKIISWWGLSFA
ncbi:recombinase family protein [Streptomyces sp. NPDC057909]|uniref:recombinase family protein n=1 Tax=Streptomyces sp. NPDC057909 TaxID=3346277 RepID=UPI0036EC4627